MLLLCILSCVWHSSEFAQVAYMSVGGRLFPSAWVTFHWQHHWRKWQPLPLEPLITNSTSGRAGTLVPLPPVMKCLWPNLVQVWCEWSHFREFVSTIAMLYPASFRGMPPDPLALKIFLPAHPWCSLSMEGEIHMYRGLHLILASVFVVLTSTESLTGSCLLF